MTIKAINLYLLMRAAIGDPGKPVVLANSSETPTSGTIYAHRR
ncbi:hypothetical protein [Halobellus sp. H-GB7]|nr:hypothetical protein [Halobellus sp. H-GB7]MDQ2054136.1 hypothetical protein [Halobellus sp. H-GB7]